MRGLAPEMTGLPIDSATPAVGEVSSAMRIQKWFRGACVRRNISVGSVADGVVHTRLQGTAEVFSHFGIDNIDTYYGSKRIDILALPASTHEGYVVGGDNAYVNNAPGQPRDVFGDLLQSFVSKLC